MLTQQLRELETDGICRSEGVPLRAAQSRVFADRTRLVAQARDAGNLRLGRESHRTNRRRGDFSNSRIRRRKSSSVARDEAAGNIGFLSPGIFKCNVAWSVAPNHPLQQTAGHDCL